jgi:hypothetical protein
VKYFYHIDRLQSITILDSTFTNVGEVLRINAVDNLRPGVIIDNIRVVGSSKVVQETGGQTLLSADIEGHIPQWSLGWSFTDEMKTGSVVFGQVSPAPTKPKILTANSYEHFFEREKPQYDGLSKSDFISVLDFGVRNDGTAGDTNPGMINTALQAVSSQNKILVFPAGIYLIEDTINIPSRCKIVGALWSQIMATGPAFSDPGHPKVVAR